MRIFPNVLKLIAGATIYLFIFSFMFIGFAEAGAPSPTNPITIHVPPRVPIPGKSTFQLAWDANWQNTGVADTVAGIKSGAYDNAYNTAIKSGSSVADAQAAGNAARARAETSLADGTIKVDANAPDAKAAQGDTSYAEFEGKRIADGKDQIKQQLEKFSEQQDTQPSLNDVICIVPRPGQNTDYGPLTDKPFEVLGQIRDTEAVHPIINGHVADESETNFELRKLGSKTWAEEKAAAAANAPKTGTQKFAANPPSEAQAKEYIASMGGNPNARGSYNINGTKVPVGQYKANDTNDRTGIVFDESCENPKSVPKVKDPGTPGGQQFGSPNQPGSGGNPGSGGGGDGGLGGLGGLGQMLPLLLASMLGGGLGGQGNQGQNGTGSNGLTNTQLSCSQYGVSPVCGSDGRTYSNSCWLQQLGQVQVSAGVCPVSSTSPTPTPDVVKIVTRLLAAGVPQSVIDTIVRSLVAFTSHANGPDVVVQ